MRREVLSDWWIAMKCQCYKAINEVLSIQDCYDQISTRSNYMLG